MTVEKYIIVLIWEHPESKVFPEYLRKVALEIKKRKDLLDELL